MDQEGSNRETTCYPTDACFDADPVPAIPGYRWRYDIDAAPGAAFEVSAGRIFNRARLELSLAQRKNNTDQMFRGITYHDGTPREERRGSTVASNARNSIDHLTVRTLLTRPIFCTNPSERVYITAWGCEIGSGRRNGLQAPGAGGLCGAPNRRV